MATIGTFKKDGNGYAGSIETLTLKARITFEPTDKKSDKAPDFRVFQIADGFTSEIGAAWKKNLPGRRGIPLRQHRRSDLRGQNQLPLGEDRS